MYIFAGAARHSFLQANTACCCGALQLVLLNKERLSLFWLGCGCNAGILSRLSCECIFFSGSCFKPRLYDPRPLRLRSGAAWAPPAAAMAMAANLIWSHRQGALNEACGPPLLHDIDTKARRGVRNAVPPWGFQEAIWWAEHGVPVEALARYARWRQSRSYGLGEQYIVTAVPPEERDLVDPRLQGDPAMHCAEGHRAREALRGSRVLESVLWVWWQALKEWRHEEDGVTEGLYLWQARKLYRHLVPEMMQGDCERVIREDWDIDRQGQRGLAYPRFKAVMVELCDIWCPGLAEEDYVRFLDGCMECVLEVRDYVPPKPRPDGSDAAAPPREMSTEERQVRAHFGLVAIARLIVWGQRARLRLAHRRLADMDARLKASRVARDLLARPAEERKPPSPRPQKVVQPGPKSGPGSRSASPRSGTRPPTARHEPVPSPSRARGLLRPQRVQRPRSADRPPSRSPPRAACPTSCPLARPKTPVRKAPPPAVLGLKKASSRLLRQPEAPPAAALSTGLQTLDDQFDAEGPDPLVRRYLDQTPEVQTAVRPPPGPTPDVLQAAPEAEAVVLSREAPAVPAESPRARLRRLEGALTAIISLLDPAAAAPASPGKALRAARRVAAEHDIRAPGLAPARARPEEADRGATLRACAAQLSRVRRRLRQLDLEGLEGTLAWVAQAAAEGGPMGLPAHAGAALRRVVEAMNAARLFRIPVALRDVLRSPAARVPVLLVRLRHVTRRERRRGMAEELRWVLAFLRTATKALPLQDLVDLLGAAQGEGVLLDVDPPTPADKLKRVVAHLLQVAQHEIHVLQEADARAEKVAALSETHALLAPWVNERGDGVVDGSAADVADTMQEVARIAEEAGLVLPGLAGGARDASALQSVFRDIRGAAQALPVAMGGEGGAGEPAALRSAAPGPDHVAVCTLVSEGPSHIASRLVSDLRHMGHNAQAVLPLEGPGGASAVLFKSSHAVRALLDYAYAASPRPGQVFTGHHVYKVEVFDRCRHCLRGPDPAAAELRSDPPPASPARRLSVHIGAVPQLSGGASVASELSQAADERPPSPGTMTSGSSLPDYDAYLALAGLNDAPEAGPSDDAPEAGPSDDAPEAGAWEAPGRPGLPPGPPPMALGVRLYTGPSAPDAARRTRAPAPLPAPHALLRPASAPPPLAHARLALPGASAAPAPAPQGPAAGRPRSAPLRPGVLNPALCCAAPSLPHPLTASTHPRSTSPGLWPPGPTLPQPRRRPRTAPMFSFRISHGVPVPGDAGGPDPLPSPAPAPLPEGTGSGPGGSPTRSGSMDSSCGLSEAPSGPEEEGLAVVGTPVMSRRSLRLLQHTGGGEGHRGATEHWRLWDR